jgi:hypothetical protein
MGTPKSKSLAFSLGVLWRDGGFVYKTAAFLKLHIDSRMDKAQYMETGFWNGGVF